MAIESTRSSFASWVPLGLALLATLMPLPCSAQATSPILVGPARSVTTIAAAARLAMPGSTILVDAGSYVGDTAVWTQDDLTLKAVNGRVKLQAAGAAAENKAIWVVRAKAFDVEGFDFEGASVDAGNGAGIRLERGSMRVRDCRFVDNDTGILTSNDTSIELDVEGSEFAHIHRIDGQNHNLYAGTIKRLSVVGSYFHHAQIGHLLKTRAASNHIAYNRLTDEAGGHASYELEFPNGGVAVVIGNVIEQSETTENPHMISFGSEGYRWPDNELYLAGNTLVDDRPQGGVFLRVAPGSGKVLAVNNLLVGKAGWNAGPAAEVRGNATVDRSALIATGSQAYRPKSASSIGARAVDAGSARGQSLAPQAEFAYPRGVRPLTSPVTLPGAFQWPGPTAR